MRRRQGWFESVLSIGLIASACGASEQAQAPVPGSSAPAKAENHAAAMGAASGPGPAVTGAASPTPSSPTPSPESPSKAARPSAMAGAGMPPVGAPVTPGVSATPPAVPAADSAPKPSGAAGAGASAPIQSGLLTAGAWDDNRNFDRFKRYRARLLQSGLVGALVTTDQEHDAAHTRFEGERAAREQLDVSLVIDTTGSMGDEIRYLQTELLALSQSIEDLYPDSDQRWSLVVYRDQGDAYVTREFDFESDVDAFRDRLAEQSAGGGGDFPEAPEAAFEAMTQLAWRTGDGVARLVFWVADAPHHEQNAEAMTEALRATAELDVHVYPVASSGIDDLTELSMRSAAQLTGGRYLFLTDDSGVGGAHQEPTIPCYFVTRLDQAILRMVSIELSGQYAEPEADEVIRTGGDPKSGRCMLESGEEVQSF